MYQVKKIGFLVKTFYVKFKFGFGNSSCLLISNQMVIKVVPIATIIFWAIFIIANLDKLA